MKLKFFPLIVLAIVSFSAITGGCSTDDPTTEIFLTDAVVFDGSSADSSFFLTTAPSTGTTVRFSTAGTIPADKGEKGDCMLIRYVIPRAPYTPGEIFLKSYGKLDYYPVKNVGGDKLEGWDTTPFYLLSYTVFLNRLVVIAGIPFSESKRELGVYVDTTSISGGRSADAYLFQRLADNSPTYRANYYLTFDLRELAEKKGLTDLRLHVNNSNLPHRNLLEIKLKQ